MINKLPPQSIESEQALLGSILIDPQAFDKISWIINEYDFYHAMHGMIYYQMQLMALKNEPIDIATITSALADSKWGDKIESGYIYSIADSVASAANIISYAKIIKEKSQLRKLIQASTETIESVYNQDGVSAKTIMENAEAKILSISEGVTKSNNGFVELKPLLLEEIENITRLYQSDKRSLELIGLSTGFHALDKKILGLQNGDLIILAARPAMGKTTMALNIAESIAANGQGVGIFSMEMGANQLARRLIGSTGRINLTRLQTGELENNDWDRISLALGKLSDSKIYMDETPALTTLEIRSRARRLKREHPDLSLIIVDYLQLASSSNNNGRSNRVEEVADISRSLKSLAKELKLPVIALSQLNRGLESRPNKRPLMSDLRDSGAIEQDADLILFIYRDEVYNPDTEYKNTAEIIISKNRNGETGSIMLGFIGENTRFENLPDYWSPDIKPNIKTNYWSEL